MALESLTENPEQSRTCLEKIREKAILVGQMMDRIFLVIQMENDMLHMQSVPVDITELMRAVADAPLPAEEEKHLVIRLSLPPDVFVQGDSLYLRQVFQNLIDNARTNTPEGGTISVSLEENGDQILIKVKDTGYGIAPEELDKIFEAYYSNRHGKRPSSGLGLYISREIIKRHGGSISVESRMGKGAEFTVQLPSLKM